MWEGAELGWSLIMNPVIFVAQDTSFILREEHPS